MSHIFVTGIFSIEVPYSQVILLWSWYQTVTSTQFFYDINNDINIEYTHIWEQFLHYFWNQVMNGNSFQIKVTPDNHILPWNNKVTVSMCQIMNERLNAWILGLDSQFTKPWSKVYFVFIDFKAMSHASQIVLKPTKFPRMISELLILLPFKFWDSRYWSPRLAMNLF